MKALFIDVSKFYLGRLLRGVSRILNNKKLLIILFNTSIVRLTGNKVNRNMYHKHTGFPGSIKKILLYQINIRNFMLRMIKININNSRLKYIVIYNKFVKLS